MKEAPVSRLLAHFDVSIRSIPSAVSRGAILILSAAAFTAIFLLMMLLVVSQVLIFVLEAPSFGWQLVSCNSIIGLIMYELKNPLVSTTV